MDCASDAVIVTDRAVPRSKIVQDAAPVELDEAAALWVVAGAEEAGEEVVWEGPVCEDRAVPPQPVSIKEARSTGNAAATEPRPSMP